MTDDTHGGELDVKPAGFNEVYTAPKEDVFVVRKEEDISEPIAIETDQNIFNVTASQEETRARIALYFTRAFLVLVGIALSAPFVLNFGFPQIVPQPLQASKELVTILASVLAGPFGFIVGFYFKQNQDG